jgi:hypothetical protein
MQSAFHADALAVGSRRDARAARGEELPALPGELCARLARAVE